MKIGVLGGTFNPVHIGHLVLAEQIRDAAGLDKVLFIPANVAPHKATGDTASGATPAGDHRMEMVRLAIAGNPFFEASDTELRRGGVSYTIDTISALRDEHPGDEFCFIIGADSVPELPSWYRTVELFDLCSFLIGERPGFAVRWEPLEQILPKTMIDQLRKNVFHTIPIGVSATDIRARVRRNHSIRYLVPDQVREYIVKHGLYK